MLLDMQSMLSGTVAANGNKTGQAITATAISENVLELNQNNNQTHPRTLSGNWLIVQVQGSADAADAAKTLRISVESDSAESIAVSPTVHFVTAPWTGATLLAGATVLRWELLGSDFKRYLALRYTVSATFAAGLSLLAYITSDPQANTSHRTGFAVV